MSKDVFLICPKCRNDWQTKFIKTTIGIVCCKECWYKDEEYEFDSEKEEFDPKYDLDYERE